MTTAREFLAAVQQRADAATEGRWVYGGQGWVFAQAVRIGDGELRDLLAQVRTNDADAEFIAAARTDVPALVAALGAVLDLAETNQYDANHDRMGFTPVLSKRTVRAVITDALTPKENDS